ncbi:hypothetical protein ACIQUL_35965 [Streptomyces sp. NPDC090303]|uniref:hypothetical protein n=1 Tax=Streptomyces sp. NPDC090303 TaxID=3365960 RepID=UPI00382C928B
MWSGGRTRWAQTRLYPQCRAVFRESAHCAAVGWYGTAATADIARAAGRESHFLNSDAFFDSVKDQVAGLNEQRSGGRLECLVYSVAAPRRIDLDTGITCASAFKPIGRANRTRTLVFDGEGVPEAREGSPPHLYCIGSPLTAAIYLQGTIGAAKAHLEATARSLTIGWTRQWAGRA